MTQPLNKDVSSLTRDGEMNKARKRGGGRELNFTNNNMHF